MHNFRSEQCMTSIDIGILRSETDFVCYKGTLPLLGRKNVREAIVSSTSFPPRLIFQSQIQELAHAFVSSLKFHSDDRYTVVHWRRGDQLSTRCVQGKDNSVNCGSAANLIDKVRSSTDDSSIYIATNEHSKSPHLDELTSAGFKTFKDSNFLHLGPVESFLIEVYMMISATTFLGWGVSEVNDVVEYERMQMGKSYCVSQQATSHKEASLTWCEVIRAAEAKSAKAKAVDSVASERSTGAVALPSSSLHSKLSSKHRYKTKANLTIPGVVDPGKSRIGAYYVSTGNISATASVGLTPTKQRLTSYLDLSKPSNDSLVFRYNKSIVWMSNNEGLFSQFLQLKVKSALSQQFERDTILSGIESPHSNNTRWTLCQMFQLPSNVKCELVVPPKFCENSALRSLDPSVIAGIDKQTLCYEGPMPLMGTHSRREANILAMYLPIPLRFTAPYLALIERFKKDLGLSPGQEYTVAHWRRGDQLVFRCKSSFRSRRDRSVNCGAADDLRRSITRLSNHSFVYVATNERSDSAHLEHLRSVGYKTYQDTQGSEFSNLNPMEVFLLEAGLMLDATTFLGWGISEINDIVEYERMRTNKTWCSARDDGPAQDAVTWCDLDVTLDTISAHSEESLSYLTGARTDTTASDSVGTPLVGEPATRVGTAGQTKRYQRQDYSGANSTEMAIMYDQITSMYEKNKSLFATSRYRLSRQNKSTLSTSPYQALPFDHTKMYNITFSKSKELLWVNDEDGLFSQYLQLKLKFQVAEKFGRVLVIPPIISHHFNYTPIIICDIFQLPPAIKCLSNPQLQGYSTKQCMSKLEDLALLSPRHLCYNGQLPLFGTEGRKDAVLLSLVTPVFPMKFNDAFLPLISHAKAELRINDSEHTRYTAVHWRRGDQLTTRCIANRDKSVNCGSAADLVALVRAQSSHEIVYVATNEAKGSPALEEVRLSGFRSLEDTKLNNFNRKLSVIEEFVVEIALMIDATTFLGFGLSEVNDVVDYQRRLVGKSWCMTKEPWMHTYATFCSYYEDAAATDQQNETIALIETITFLEEAELATVIEDTED